MKHGAHFKLPIGLSKTNCLRAVAKLPHFCIISLQETKQSCHSSRWRIMRNTKLVSPGDPRMTSERYLVKFAFVIFSRNETAVILQDGGL